MENQGLRQELGVRLLKRTTRSVAPTQSGEELVARLAPLLRELDEALADVNVGRERPKGTLRLTASATASMFLLEDIVPRFLQQYPDVTLDLVADPAFADIVAQGFDAGVRLGEAVPRDMVAVRFGGESRMLTVASPAYLDGREPPQTPEGLADHRCVRSRTPNGRPYRWEFERDGHALSIDVPGQLILNRTELMAQAALAGAGIAFIPQRVAAPYLADSRLKAMLEDGSPAYPGLFLYYPGHRHVPPSLRAFINVIRATR